LLGKVFDSASVCEEALCFGAFGFADFGLGPDVDPVGRYLHEPGARHSQLFVLPANLVQAWLLEHVPKAHALFGVTSLAVE
jgi:hypothetical protein